jgi:hypothetical protein
VDLLAEIRSEVRRGAPCGTGRLIASLDEDVQQAIAQAFAEGLPVTAIAAWLAKRQTNIAPQTLRYHLAGRCQCPR